MKTQMAAGVATVTDLRLWPETRRPLLQGIVIKCTSCGSVRDRNARWRPMTHYDPDLSEALFSHVICRHCFEREVEEIRRSFSRRPAS